MPGGNSQNGPMLTLFRKGLETKFLQTLNAIKARPQGYFGVHLRFSNLLEHYKSDYQLKISINIIQDLLKEATGNLTVAPDSDIFIICSNTSTQQLGKLIFQLRYLYMDDPLAYHSDGVENDEFSHIYVLAHEWQQFFPICREKLYAEAPKEPQKDGKIRTLTPSRLASIETDLHKADISKALRKQPVCAGVPGKGFKAVFDEIYINIAALRQIIAPDTEFGTNRWLFRYLTQVLDSKLLDFLKSNQAEFLSRPASINLNIETILSEKFTEFDQALNKATKASIVLEIQISDVFTDMNAFLTAKNMVHKHGYRICLDGMNYLSFQQVDRLSLGFDLAKMYWNADAEENPALKEAIKKCGQSRVILCRCDGQEAVEYGQSLGISLFQGRHVDSLLNPSSRVVN